MKKYLRRHAYRWHRITSLIVALPVLLWTISGFLHPVMNSFKPQVKNHSLPISVLDSSRIRMSIGEVLSQHKIESIQQFRIVEMYGSFYYQVKQAGNEKLLYISCYNGQLLLNGDVQYAGFIGQRYVSESNQNSGKTEHHGAAATLKTLVKNHGMNPDKINIRDVQLVTAFTDEYKSSNVLLPVYRVDFDRKDNLRLYIDPLSGKLATAMNDHKAWFTKFFAVTHSWSFMNGLGYLKHILIGSISILCLISSLLGYYVHNLTKPGKGRKTTSRKAHRIMGNVFVVTTLLYAFSGGWHSLHKLKEKETVNKVKPSSLATASLGMNFKYLLPKNDSTRKPVDFSAVPFGKEVYWQLTLASEGKLQKIYFTPFGELVKNGDENYAMQLAGKFSGRQESEIVSVKKITKFNSRYSMMKKRLPVMEVSYKDGISWFIDTSTGALAAVADDTDAAERFSFSNLHMHHYWEDFFGMEKGKVFKNLVLISSTLGLLLLAITGILMYRAKIKKRKSSATNLV